MAKQAVLPDSIDTDMPIRLEIETRTRVVLRTVLQKCNVSCHHCNKPILWHPKKKHTQVICNVYERNVWQRVEQYHATCYDEAGQPYGVASR